MTRNELMSNEDFRNIAAFSGITEESSDQDFRYFVGTFKDATEHGMSSGCMNSFIYTDDCMRFFDLHRDRIAQVVFEDCEVSLGDLCQQFAITDAEVVMQKGLFKNYVTWAYVECVGSGLIDEMEEYLNE